MILFISMSNRITVSVIFKLDLEARRRTGTSGGHFTTTTTIHWNRLFCLKISSSTGQLLPPSKTCLFLFYSVPHITDPTERGPVVGGQEEETGEKTTEMSAMLIWKTNVWVYFLIDAFALSDELFLQQMGENAPDTALCRSSRRYLIPCWSGHRNDSRTTWISCESDDVEMNMTRTDQPKQKKLNRDVEEKQKQAQFTLWTEVLIELYRP